MLEHKILKSFLNKECYDAHRKYLTTVSDGMKPWFDTVDWWHANKDSSLNVDDLYDIHVKMFHPVATQKQKDLMLATFNLIKDSEANTEVVGTLIDTKYKQDRYADLADQLIRLSEGRTDSSFDEILKEIKDFDAHRPTMHEFPPVVISAQEMIDATTAQAKWKFHLPVLREKVTGIGPGIFALVAARPEAGKSLFMVSCCFHPEGWAAQGAKIVYMGNEEAIHRTKFRAVLCWSGMESNYAKAHYEEFAKKVVEFDTRFIDTGQIIFYHETGMEYHKVAALIEEHKPDILVIDQLDKLRASGVGDKLAEMDAIYTNMREYSVKYNMAIFGVSQASADATGKRHFGYEMLEHSKTRKAAELDLCICIGAESLIEDNNVRYINLAKCKIGNDAGNIATYMINKQVSRMEV